MEASAPLPPPPSKEKLPPSPLLSPPILSAEQKRRIDQNFRAAKAILSRKKLRTSPSLPSPPTWKPFKSSSGDPMPANEELGSVSLAAHHLQQSSHQTENRTSYERGHPNASVEVDVSSVMESSNRVIQRPPLAVKDTNKPFNQHEGTPVPRSMRNISPTDSENNFTPSSKHDAQRTLQNSSFHLVSQNMRPVSIGETLLLLDPELDANFIKQLDAITNSTPLLSEEMPSNTHRGSISVNGHHSHVSKEGYDKENFSNQSRRDFASKESPVKGLEDSQRIVPNVACITSSVHTDSEEINRFISDDVMHRTYENRAHSHGSYSNNSVSNCLIDVSKICSELSIPLRNSNNAVRIAPLDNLQQGYDHLINTEITHDSSCPSSLISSQISFSKFDVKPIYLESLNESQKGAVLSDIQKPLLILAGPGSGKTSTMVARLLRLLDEGVSARNILAMTFTTAAATEMRERVGGHVGKLTSKELNICTFHSFCLQFCRTHAEKLGRSPEFIVYGRGQQRRAVVEATRLASCELQTSKDCTLSKVVKITDGHSREGQQADELINSKALKERAKIWDKFVTQAKASGRIPEFYESLGNSEGAAVLRHYNATLTACDALDYHDLINCAVSLLREHCDVLDQCLKTWTCVLVDEFQDTSKMQYELLRMLASHKRVTVVGDDDQSIFSFNGADSSNFEAFRRDFAELKEVRLQHNYRSTKCIVEAAASLIGNNIKRCENKHASTDNDFGEKITVKECRNDDAQCCFVIDTILMKSQKNSTNTPMYGNYAILYRRQITGKVFQSALRSRKIPFNIHGVAFYRKKIVKTVIAMLWAALDSQTVYCSRIYKALYGGDKTEAKKVVEYVEKVANASHCSFLDSARKIFTAKVSGTFSRRQIACGRKVLSIIDAVYALARKEHSLSTLVTAVMNFVPQKSALQNRAILAVDDGKFLNEDDDPRTILEYLLDDVSDFLRNHYDFDKTSMCKLDGFQEGCLYELKSFLDHMTLRESGNFKTRREENKNSITLTTIHQSKGLEWDTVFIVKANDSEIPLLNESMGNVNDSCTSLEEERRLFYVAMTRAKKKLYILYTTWDQNQQLLHPTRFFRELPQQYVDYELDGGKVILQERACVHRFQHTTDAHESIISNDPLQVGKEDSLHVHSSMDFLKGFNVDARSTIASIFHSWAKKPAFQDPKRLLDKVCFVIDERMRNKATKNKDTLRAFKCSLDTREAVDYAQHVINWVRIPSEERVLLMSEKQEFFQQKCAERAMGSAPPTEKQVSYLRMLGCTIDPTSRLHASRLIEQYKKI